VSIKSIHFRDEGTKRYTKNYSRNDNELRAEATDYHKRQPYAVMVGVIFLPVDSCDDARTGKGDEAGISSFAAAVKFFKDRVQRASPRDELDLFESFFVALYKDNGDVCFFDVMRPPPKAGRPLTSDCLDLEHFVREVVRTYKARNERPFVWAQESAGEAPDRFF
jgi:hypothetical protein